MTLRKFGAGVDVRGSALRLGTGFFNMRLRNMGLGNAKLACRGCRPNGCVRLGLRAVGLRLDANRGELRRRPNPFRREHGLGHIELEELAPLILVGPCRASQCQKSNANRCNKSVFQDHQRAS